MTKVMLLFFVSFLCLSIGSFGYVEHKCLHDQLSDTYLQLPTAKPQSGTWGSFRIKFFAEDLKNDSVFCTSSDDTMENIFNYRSACEHDDALTEAKKEILLQRIVPAAIQLHTDRLEVRRANTNIRFTPHSYGICSYITVPKEHNTNGVSDADLVVYVAVRGFESTYSSSFTWSGVCAWNEFGRPNVGVIIFSPKFIEDSQHLVRVTAHELTHIFGFNSKQMRHNKLLSHFPEGFAKRFTESLVTTTHTKQKAIEHYGCANAKGMEMEIEPDFSKISVSHWERRIAKDELMSPIVTSGYYTILTMGLLADLGFYKPKWEKAEPMSWGKSKGCDFLNGKCLENGKEKFLGMFCTEKTEFLRCTSDRLALGTCIIYDRQSDISTPFRYFASPKTAGDAETLTDYCPVIVPSLNRGCDSTMTGDMPESLLGPSSRCLKGESLQINNKEIGDVCANIKCENKKVSIQYKGDTKWHICENEEQKITPTATFGSGSILCPKYEDVCTIPLSPPKMTEATTDTRSPLAPKKEPERKKEEREEHPNGAPKDEKVVVKPLEPKVEEDIYKHYQNVAPVKAVEQIDANAEDYQSKQQEVNGGMNPKKSGDVVSEDEGENLKTKRDQTEPSQQEVLQALNAPNNEKEPQEGSNNSKSSVKDNQNVKVQEVKPPKSDDGIEPVKIHAALNPQKVIENVTPEPNSTTTDATNPINDTKTKHNPDVARPQGNDEVTEEHMEKKHLPMTMPILEGAKSNATIEISLKKTEEKEKTEESKKNDSKKSSAPILEGKKNALTKVKNESQIKKGKKGANDDTKRGNDKTEETENETLIHVNTQNTMENGNVDHCVLLCILSRTVLFIVFWFTAVMV